MLEVAGRECARAQQQAQRPAAHATCHTPNHSKQAGRKAHLPLHSFIRLFCLLLSLLLLLLLLLVALGPVSLALAAALQQKRRQAAPGGEVKQVSLHCTTSIGPSPRQAKATFLGYPLQALLLSSRASARGWEEALPEVGCQPRVPSLAQLSANCKSNAAQPAGQTHLPLCHRLEFEVSVGGTPRRLHQVALACGRGRAGGVEASGLSHVEWRHATHSAGHCTRWPVHKMPPRHCSSGAVQCTLPAEQAAKLAHQPLTGLGDADEQALKLLDLEDEVGHLRQQTNGTAA